MPRNRRWPVIALSRSSGARHRDGRGRRQRADATPRRSCTTSGCGATFRTPSEVLDACRTQSVGDNAANGLNDVHRITALVGPQSRDAFAFQAQMVPANIVAHENA